jgi:SpoVK/Ycf46/Vps4 family AAA+-type ATPase
MTKDEAMKLALEALETHGAPLLNHEDAYSASLTALRQAIEEAEKQEPDDLTIAYMAGFYDGKNKYAPRREWVGLTDDEISASSKGHMTRIGFARAVEAKVKEKNNESC